MSRILIVDDDKATRDGLALALGHDYAVLTAADAEAALRALTEHEVDLVLTDLRMPGRDGLSLLRDIIASHPGLPVILLSPMALWRARWRPCATAPWTSLPSL